MPNDQEHSPLSYPLDFNVAALSAKLEALQRQVDAFERRYENSHKDLKIDLEHEIANLSLDAKAQYIGLSDKIDKLSKTATIVGFMGRIAYAIAGATITLLSTWGFLKH